MEAKLRQAFGAWPKGPAVKEEKIEFTPAKPGYYLVPKDDVNQSNIHMVALGTTRDNPDYYAIRSLTKPSAAAFHRACSATFAPPRVWPMRSAAASEQLLIIPACCGW